MHFFLFAYYATSYHCYYLDFLYTFTFAPLPTPLPSTTFSLLCLLHGCLPSTIYRFGCVAQPPPFIPPEGWLRARAAPFPAPHATTPSFAAPSPHYPPAGYGTDNCPDEPAVADLQCGKTLDCHVAGGDVLNLMPAYICCHCLLRAHLQALPCLPALACPAATPACPVLACRCMPQAHHLPIHTGFDRA